MHVLEQSARLGPAFTDALLAVIPTLAEHGCSYGVPAFRREARGVVVAEREPND